MFFDTKYFWAVFTSRDQQTANKLRGLFDRSSTLALADFSLAIDGDRPTITAVVGESGSGKTTLGRLLLGLAAPR